MTTDDLKAIDRARMFWDVVGSVASGAMMFALGGIVFAALWTDRRDAGPLWHLILVGGAGMLVWSAERRASLRGRLRNQ